MHKSRQSSCGFRPEHFSFPTFQFIRISFSLPISIAVIPIPPHLHRTMNQAEGKKMNLRIFEILFHKKVRTVWASIMPIPKICKPIPQLSRFRPLTSCQDIFRPTHTPLPFLEISDINLSCICTGFIQEHTAK